MWSLSRILGTRDRPALSATSVRQLARLGTLVRWPGVLFGALVAIIQPPKSPILLALLLLWVAIYNGWGMLTIPRTPDESIQRLGRSLSLLDTVSFFGFLAIFAGLAPTSFYAAYILIMIWMVAYDGVEGAVLALAIFVVGMIALQGARSAFFHMGFTGTDIVLWSLIMALAATIIGAFDRIVVGGMIAQAATGVAPQLAPTSPTHVTEVSVSSANGATIRLSRREQEVLRLVAEGYSNSMIASRLHLSENTIKTYMETLLTRFNARNRAEAVAAASRQNLI